MTSPPPPPLIWIQVLDCGVIHVMYQWRLLVLCGTLKAPHNITDILLWHVWDRTLKLAYYMKNQLKQSTRSWRWVEGVVSWLAVGHFSEQNHWVCPGLRRCHTLLTWNQDCAGTDNSDRFNILIQTHAWPVGATDTISVCIFVLMCAYVRMRGCYKTASHRISYLLCSI